MNQTTDRDKAILWARELLSRSDWVVLDTETTGIRQAQIVQIGLLSPSGEVLLDSLVKPSIPIPAQATAIHGITDADVAGAPSLADLQHRMAFLMHSREVVIYNKGFDQGILYLQLRGLLGDRGADEWISACTRWTCAMEPYSAFVGDWNDYHGNYRWQKLPGAGHSAIEDCRATLRLIQRMAGAKVSAEEGEQQ